MNYFDETKTTQFHQSYGLQGDESGEKTTKPQLQIEMSKKTSQKGFEWIWSKYLVWSRTEGRTSCW